MHPDIHHLPVSRIMAAVRSSQNQSTELRLIALFRQIHITGWRRHYPLFGSPDFTFPKQKLALFVDGCFWHRHSCKQGRSMPATNVSYWKSKFFRNSNRDRIVRHRLKKLGWKIFTVWECQLKRPQPLTIRLKRILQS